MLLQDPTLTPPVLLTDAETVGGCRVATTCRLPPGLSNSKHSREEELGDIRKRRWDTVRLGAVFTVYIQFGASSTTPAQPGSHNSATAAFVKYLSVI